MGERLRQLTVRASHSPGVYRDPAQAGLVSSPARSMDVAEARRLLREAIDLELGS
jgi:hypothetical protein